MRILLFFLVFVLGYNVFPQQLKPIDTADYPHRIQLIKVYEQENRDFNKSLRSQYKGKLRAELKSYYEFSQEEFLNNIEDRQIVFDDRFTSYLDSITTVLTSVHGPEGLQKFKLLVSRSNEANAFCLPDGTLVLHMGLFRWLENEEQFISVICHELAHNELQHPQRTFLSKATFSTSSRLRDELKTIRKQKKRKNEKAFSLLKSVLYAQGSKRRSQEMDADKSGYQIFKKLEVENHEFLNALLRLQELDSIPSLEVAVEEYRKVFDLPEMPYNEAWLEEEDYSEYNYDLYQAKIDEDSVISHPETQMRIDQLRKQFQELSSDQPSKALDTISRFYQLKLLADQEVINNYHTLEEYGKSAYITVSRLAKDPESKILRSWLAKNFVQLAKAKKSYTFNKYVEHVVPEMKDKSYRRFLSFLWNLKLNEIETIAAHYGQ